MFFREDSTCGLFPPGFPRGGCPLFGGLVGHLRQRSEDLVEIFLRDDRKRPIGDPLVRFF